MGAAAEQLPEIAGERADVRAGRARHAHVQQVPLAAQDVETLDRHRASGQLDLFAGAHPRIRPHTADLDGTDRARNLLDLPGQARHCGCDLLIRDARGRPGGQHLALGVVGAGADPEQDRGVVRLLGEQQVAEQPRGAPDSADQHTGRGGVERSGMTDAAGAGDPAEPGHHVVGGETGRLGDDDQPAGDRPRLHARITEQRKAPREAG